jgi:hypothetical protein
MKAGMEQKHAAKSRLTALGAAARRVGMFVRLRWARLWLCLGRTIAGTRYAAARPSAENCSGFARSERQDRKLRRKPLRSLESRRKRHGLRTLGPTICRPCGGWSRQGASPRQGRATPAISSTAQGDWKLRRHALKGLDLGSEIALPGVAPQDPAQRMGQICHREEPMVCVLRDAAIRAAPTVQCLSARCLSAQPVENARNGNGRRLQKVGMGLDSAPHPLGAGARNCGPHRPVSDWRRMRRSIRVCSTTEMTITRPKASWV